MFYLLLCLDSSVLIDDEDQWVVRLENAELLHKCIAA